MDTTREFHRPTIGTPLRAVWNLVKEMNRIADATTPAGMDCVRSAGRPRRPKAQIFDRGADTVIRCELAEVSAAEVRVNCSAGHLTVSGRCSSDADRDIGAGYVGPFDGAFRRDFSLPAGVSPDRVHADLEDGTLEITIDAAALAEVEVGIPVNGSAQVPAPREPVPEVPAAQVPQSA